MQKILAVFLVLITLQWITGTSAFAQDINNGKVVDEKGVPVKDVEVSINDRLEFTTNAQGEFHFMLPKGSTLTDIKATKKGLKVKKWEYFQDRKEVQVIMQAAASMVLKGKIVDENSKPVKGAQVILDGVNSVNIVSSGTGGVFSMKLPPEADMNKIGFLVNGSLVSKANVTFSPTKDFVTLKVPGLRSTEGTANTGVGKNDPVTSPDNQPVAPAITEPVKPVSNPSKPPVVHPKPVINIEVYDEKDVPVQGLKITVNGKQYVTDQRGEFQLKASVNDDIQFVIDDYDIERKDFDENDIYLYIRKKVDPLSPQVNNYQQDFHRVVDQLELKKQLLAEKSIHIREEIDEITNKLRRDPPITPEQRVKLKQYLRTLEKSLIESEVAFEEAEEKTQVVVDRMRSVIIEKDSLNIIAQKKLEQTEAEKRVAELELAIFVIVAIGMLILAVVFYGLARRMKKQNHEIHAQKLEIEHAYQNIKTLSHIGQKVTSALDLKVIIQTVNANLQALVNASAFGVGIYNPLESKIEFTDFIENGATQLYHFESLHETDKLSVWCLKNRQPVIINDPETDFHKYIAPGEKVAPGGLAKSLVYLPLVIEGKALGVVTVQSDKLHAYSDIDINVLETLASYISIALANANSYQVIKSKNKHITDSIRYAQTIQQAVLPGPRELNETLKEHFVVYRPKDIVSGDFYWLDYIPASTLPLHEQVTGDKTFFAVIDCTGHGVPGGFMSMVANHLLSEIVNVKRIFDPALVLETLDLRVREALKQYDKVNDDGMDVGLCLMEQVPGQDSKVSITFAGARRPLYYYLQHENKLEQLKGDRASIGGMHHKEHAFTNQKLILDKGDILYLTTDGLADQNDINRVKFTTVRLKTLLHTNASLEASQQKALIEATLDSYMQGVEQRDDITIVGIRV